MEGNLTLRFLGNDLMCLPYANIVGNLLVELIVPGKAFDSV